MTSPWWRPEAHADRRPFLLARGAIRHAARAHFEAAGLIAVQGGALHASAADGGRPPDLATLAADRVEEGGERERLSLHTSPEFACKKLLAGGERRIFDFARVYRNREAGPLHAPEFTMLEWYRAGEPYEAVMADSVALC